MRVMGTRVVGLGEGSLEGRKDDEVAAWPRRREMWVCAYVSAQTVPTAGRQTNGSCNWQVIAGY
jgi:hypothetical protein